MIKRVYFILFLTFLFSIIILSPSFAGTQEWKSLNYDATVLSNGDMEVIETWNVYISETNTLFKDFNVDREKYSEIKDVRVSRVDNGKEQFLSEIYEEQYHVDSGCYYGLYINNGSKFEIAWNVGLDNSSDTRTYKIYYTVEDAIRVYNDCTELYWQFLGSENTMEGDNITGTIKLPKPVSNIEKLRVWAHGPLDGDISKVSNDTVSFKVDYYSGGMLEVRVVTDENIYYINNTIKQNKLDSIIEEETKWAEEANARRKREAIGYGALIIGWLGSNIGVTILLITKAHKYLQMRKELDVIEYPKNELEYFRDIPNEKDATPARADYIYTFNRDDGNVNLSVVFPATILDLSIKGYIELKPLEKDEIEIIVKKDRSIDLPSDEQVIFDLITKCCTHYKKDSITTKEFSKYTKKEYEMVHADMSLIDKYAEQFHESQKNVDADRKKLYQMWNSKFSGYILGFWVFVMLFYLAFLFIPIVVMVLVCSIICVRNRNIIKTCLTEKGYEEQNEWKALKKYLEDYSLLKERSVPDIILWEKYLVYATVFGISEKVLKQLKVDYPQFFDGTYDNYAGRYTYFSLLNNNSSFNSSFKSLERSLLSAYTSANNAYSSAHYSSGSGGGGGFSGGGGGRRRRWPVAVDVKKYKKTLALLY